MSFQLCYSMRISRPSVCDYGQQHHRTIVSQGSEHSNTRIYTQGSKPWDDRYVLVQRSQSVHYPGPEPVFYSREIDIPMVQPADGCVVRMRRRLFLVHSTQLFIKRRYIYPVVYLLSTIVSVHSSSSLLLLMLVLFFISVYHGQLVSFKTSFFTLFQGCHCKTLIVLSTDFVGGVYKIYVTVHGVNLRQDYSQPNERFTTIVTLYPSVFMCAFQSLRWIIP